MGNRAVLGHGTMTSRYIPKKDRRSSAPVAIPYWLASLSVMELRRLKELSMGSGRFWPWDALIKMAELK
jgi:hypothetical protein